MTPLLDPSGENVIAVKVNNATNKDIPPLNADFTFFGGLYRGVNVLVLDPLWFLGVYAVLTALTPLAVTLVRRLGAWAALIPFTLVAVIDAVRFGLGGPAWVGWINVAAGWLVPYLLGIAWARGAFRGGKIPALMPTRPPRTSRPGRTWLA